LEGLDEVEAEDKDLEDDVRQVSRFNQPKVSGEAAAHLL